jgi:hypothetical protein
MDLAFLDWRGAFARHRPTEALPCDPTLLSRSQGMILFGLGGGFVNGLGEERTLNRERANLQFPSRTPQIERDSSEVRSIASLRVVAAWEGSPC